MNPTIQSVSVDGKEIQKLIFDKLVPSLEGENLAHSVLAMLTFTVLLLKPDVDMEELQAVVMGASEYMVTLLASVDGEAN